MIIFYQICLNRCKFSQNETKFNILRLLLAAEVRKIIPKGLHIYSIVYFDKNAEVRKTIPKGLHINRYCIKSMFDPEGGACFLLLQSINI